jgi:alkanesulfonate monooxygenase SsuD/methylene tetrahydromethanopterin reductase-like flavin-dependent oxidoreductase (luciferase family)
MWQAITSPPTLEQVPRNGWGGVMWLKHFEFMKRYWDRFADVYHETHGVELAAGEKRTLVVNTCIADSHEEAVASVRNGHDEFWKFLGPYGWSKGYMGEGGKPAEAGLIPSLEESLDNKVWLVGTADEVAEQIQWYRDYLGGVDNLVLFPAMPGDSYNKVDDQLHRIAEGVLPQLS